MQFANYIIQQQAVANGCLGRINIEGGSGGDKMASIFTDIKQGERYTTVVERDLILASDHCPLSTGDNTNSSSVYIPTPGSAVWGVSLNADISGSATAYGSAIDADGNIYITGFYSSTTTKLSIYNYTGTSDTTITQSLYGYLPAANNNSIFIIKYNSSGVVQWATNIPGNASGSQNGYTLITDSNGNIYTVVAVIGTTTINNFTSGGGGTDITLTKYADVSTSSRDVLIVKYNSSGVVQWVARIQGSLFLEDITNGYVENSLIDSNGDLIFGFTSNSGDAGFVNLDSFSSYSSPTVTFSTFARSPGGNGVYLCKINSSGSFQWVSKSVASAGTNFWTLALDSNDNIYLVHAVNGNITFNSYGSISGSPLTVSYNSTGTATLKGTVDGYIAKLNSSGTFLLAAQIGTASFSLRDNAITIDSNNNIYIAFRYSANSATKLNIYSSDGVALSGSTAIGLTAWGSLPASTNATGYEVGIAKFNTSLVCQGATLLSSTNNGASPSSIIFTNAVQYDSDGNIYITGQFNNTPLTIFNYDTGGGGENTNITTTTFGTLANAGTVSLYECFLIKYNSSLVAQWATRMNSIGNDRGWGLSVDRPNRYVYVAGQYITNNTANLNFNNYSSVSGGVVNLATGLIMPYPVNTTTNRTYGFLVKYAL